MSTLNDTFSTFAATVTKPLFDKLSESAGTLNDELTAAQPQIDAFADLLATDLQNAITWLTGESGLPSVETVIANLTTAWNESRDALVTFVQALSRDWEDDATKIEPLDRVMGNLALVIGDVTAALGAVAGALTATDDPLTTAEENVTTLADSLAAIHETTQNLGTRAQGFQRNVRAPVWSDRWHDRGDPGPRHRRPRRGDPYLGQLERGDRNGHRLDQRCDRAFKALGRVIVPIPAASSGTGGGPSTFGPMALGGAGAGVVSGIPVTPSFSMVPRRPVRGRAHRRRDRGRPRIVINVDARGCP